MKYLKEIILGLIVGILVGGLIIWLVPGKEIIVKVPEIKENIEKIDSLRDRITRDSLRFDSLVRVKQKVIKEVIVRVEKQKTLPVDSAIIEFHKNTETYGELHSEVPVLQADSSVLCSADNIRDANIMAVKLGGALEKGETMEKMLAIDSQIIERKDSIIYESSIILKKTETAYESSIQQLSADLKKERKKNNLTKWFGGTAVVILGSLILLK